MFERRNNEYAIDELSLLDHRLREVAGVDVPVAKDAHLTPHRRIFDPRRMAVAGLTCAAVVACAAVLLVPAGGRHEDRIEAASRPVTLTPLSKREAIALISKNAATGGLEFPRGDQFFHTRWERTIRAGGFEAVTPGAGPPTVKYTDQRSDVEDRWTSFYREGASRTEIKSITYPTERDRKIAKRLQALEQPGVQWGSWSPEFFYYLGSKSFSREELIGYRPTPQQLVEDLSRHPIVDYEGDATGIWASLMETMTIHSLPEHIRATAIKALGMIPSVEILGARRDRLGRQGYLFAMEHDGERHEMLIDPETAQVLRMRIVIVATDNEHDAAAIGDVVTDQLLTRFEVVDDLPPDAAANPSRNGPMPAAEIATERRFAAEAHRRDKIAIQKR